MMKKHIMLCALLVFCLLVMAGCGQREKDSKDTEDSGDGAVNLVKDAEEIVRDVGDTEEAAPTGEYVPMADFIMLPVPDSCYEGGCNGECLYVDSEVFYVEIAGGSGNWEGRLLAAATDGTGSPRVVAEGSEGAGVWNFYVDKERNLYLYEEKSFYDEALGTRQNYYYLEKRDSEGRKLYRVDLTGLVESMDTIGDEIKVYADGEGNVALLDFFRDQVVFLDSEGQYQDQAGFAGGAAEMHHLANNIVCAGERYFLWNFDFYRNSIILSEIDFKNGLVSKEMTLSASAVSAKTTSGFDCVLLDGGEQGPLISTKDALWQYDMETGEAAEIFRWDDKAVGLDGRYVAQVRWGNAGEGGVPMDVLAYEDCTGGMYTGLMAASITYVDKAYLPRRQIVSVGIHPIPSGKIEKTVLRFNRLNKEYEAVLAEYSAGDLQELLMYGGEVPDLLDVTGIRTGWLESKNLLEDLSPYFEKSGRVGKKDILPCVWELLEKDGKLPSMAASFKIRTMITAAPIPEEGWDYGQFLGLGGQYPESRYFSTYNTMQVWDAVSVTAVEDYIDWKKRKCSFNSREFRNLLEEIKNLDYPRNQTVGSVTDTQEQIEKLISRQTLLQIEDLGSAHGYDTLQYYSNEIKSVGYPTVDGEPLFLFSPSQNLAIYGKSPCKDGAWAFMEFLLSEKEQEWYASDREVFPVHAEAFEEYLTRPYFASSGNIKQRSSVEELEDTPDRIRYMAQHMGISQNAADEIQSILSEELQAYFKGDKTVKETVKIIQNRAQLYLDEL